MAERSGNSWVLVTASAVALVFVMLGYLAVNVPKVPVAKPVVQASSVELAARYRALLSGLARELQPMLARELSSSDVLALNRIIDQITSWSVPASERDFHLVLTIKLRALGDVLSPGTARLAAASPSLSETQTEIMNLLSSELSVTSSQ